MNHHRDRNRRRPKKVSIKDRKSKVHIEDLATMPEDFSWYRNLSQMIPRILRGKDIEDLSARLVEARRRARPVVIMLGAHVVKCGLGGLLCHLIRKNLITGIAMNGACAIHDIEIAMWGKTSEDVGEGLRCGSFGMVEETSQFFNAAARCSAEAGIGFGEGLGRTLLEASPPHQNVSIIATSYSLGIPVTVHVALGTDIVHQHEEADGKAIGYATMEDFRRFTMIVINLNGGVILNVGSAVIMPEVFLKALAIACNRNADLGDFTTANFDMFSQYRPMANIVQRPRLVGATTYHFQGNHEILLPVFFASVLSKATL